MASSNPSRPPPHDRLASIATRAAPRTLATEKSLSGPTPTEPGRVARGNGWEYLVREPFFGDFPGGRFATYGDFLAAQGEVLKAEARSRVILLRGSGAGDPAEPSRAFVLKVYRYPAARALRTLFRRSRGEQEFRNLLHLRALGVPTVEAVAWGVERNAWGMVRSSFVVTRYMEGCLDLKGWQNGHGLALAQGEARRDRILREVGRLFRLIHASGFFLFTPKPSNILIRPGGDGPPDLLFLDLPRAGTVRPAFLRGFAQARDLGIFLRDFPRGGAPDDWEAFYEGYLPDPLGGDPDRLRRRAAREVLAQRNQTPLTALVHGIKRRIRHASRGPSRAAARDAGE